MRPLTATIVDCFYSLQEASEIALFPFSTRDRSLFFANAPLRIPLQFLTARPRPCQTPQAVSAHRLHASASNHPASAERGPARTLAPGAAATALNPSAMSIETAAPAHPRIPGKPF